jgi:hypothetical protein
MNRSYSPPGVSLLVSPDPPRATAPAQLRVCQHFVAGPTSTLSGLSIRSQGCCPNGQRASPSRTRSRREKGPFRGPCSARFPARRSTPPNLRLGLPPHVGGRLLLAAAAALEPLDHGAPWTALFGALLEEATGDRVAYPAAFACASLLSHALKLLQPTCPFNPAARPPHKRPRRTAHRAHRPGRLRCSATRARAG